MDRGLSDPEAGPDNCTRAAHELPTAPFSVLAALGRGGSSLVLPSPTGARPALRHHSVPVDVTAVDATLSFDCRVRVARADAVVHFTVSDEPAVFDLRQEIDEAVLDGERLDLARLASTPDDVRLIDVPLEAGDHELHVRYALDLPRTTEPLPIGWTTNSPGVVFDLWMSDLYPGRYLESWIPAPLCHDRFALTVNLEISGTSLPHAVFANGEYTANGVRYPESFTALSPMLVIAPEARVEIEEAGGITVSKLAGPEIDLGQCHSMIRECLDHNNAVFGEYGFGDSFLAYIWGTTRGMEYDGATTSAVGSLEHEVFHSWFGRGVKPATANDGWIDEAFCVWYTAGPPRQRRYAQAFDRDEPPVLLRPSGDYARYTPRESYTAGPRFFAGVAALLGGPEALVEVMAGLYRERRGGFVSTDDLKYVLSEAVGQDLTWAFDRWIYGVGGEEDS